MIAVADAAALSGWFLRPLGLAALAAVVPIVLLYLLKPDPTRVAFPAVEFLVGDRERSRRHPALRRLQRSLLLVLQVLAVALVAVSLAAPYVPVSEQRTVSETVVVVDASASMATAADGSTRFDRAVAAARDETTAETSVVVAGARPSVAARRVPAAEARAVLDGLSVTHAPGDLGSAVSRAAAVAGRNARVVVLSDFAGDGWRTAVDAARARGLSVSLRQFDGGGDANVGVVDYAFDAGSVTVRVKNYGDARAERRVELGNASRSVTLDPGGVTTATLPVPAGGGRLRLSPRDSFRADDAIPVAAPDDATLDVLVVSNDVDRSLVTALSVVRGTEVTVKHPPASVSGRYDVVVFSGVEPGQLLDGTRQVARETLARGGGVVVQAQPNLSAVDYGVPLPFRPTGTGTDPALRESAAHPLTEDVTFPAPSWYVTGQLRSGRTLLRTVNGTPLLGVAEVNGGRVLYDGYAPNGSTFDRNYRYPVFWKRAVHHLTGRRSLAELNRPTGETLRLANGTTVETPDGSRRTGSLRLRLTGVYEADDRRWAASLADSAESNVTAPPVDRGGDGTDGRTDTEHVPLDLTPAAAGLTGLAVLLELGFLRYRGDL